MGNCLPKLRKKNKVFPDRSLTVSKTKETNVSDILRRSSASLSMSSSRPGSSETQLEMVRKLTESDIDSTLAESVVLDKEKNILDDLKKPAQPAVIKKPVFFQIDFVQGMPHKIPSRLAERMDQKVEAKKSEQLALTEEDEVLMNEIMEEIEGKEKLDKLAELQLAAQNLRDQHLQSIREKARGMSSRPQTRAGQYGVGCGGGKRIKGERGGGGDGRDGVGREGCRERGYFYRPRISFCRNV